MKTFFRLALALLLAFGLQAAHAEKVLRYAFSIAETGFDPAQVGDEYSRTVTAHVFEALYGYDPLAMPTKVVPLTATAMPEVSADFKTFTIHIKPGIYFTDDAAFKGRRRELVAEDYVYTLKRFADPAVKSPNWSSIEEQGILGLVELRRAAEQGGKPFNYDQPIEGLRALDRYTLQIRLAEPRPRLTDLLANSSLVGAVAREVAEAYGVDDMMAHPVGTGPFVLKEWRRSSRIVLARNAAYRERYYESEPAADDAEGQAIARQLRGRRLPMIDRVEISIIEESQPRWLAFLNGEQDLLSRVPPEFVNIAMPNGKIAPNLGRRGMKLYRALVADCAFFYFNMEDPVVGGYTPEQVALRRAISLAWDTSREIRLLRRGQAVPAQSIVMPNTSGYDPTFKSETTDFDPGRANALLDLYGYALHKGDGERDGWRDRPDGSPLVVEWTTQPDALSRSYAEMFRINMERIHIRTSYPSAKWPENYKAAQAGKLMLWFLATTAESSDGGDALSSMYGPQAGNQNYARFRNAEFDKLYERTRVLPNGPERDALFLQAKRIETAYMPMKTQVHRIVNDIAEPWVIGYRRPLFRNEFWQFVDIAPQQR